MESNAFIHEVYRRMQGRYVENSSRPNFEEIKLTQSVKKAVDDYKALLPQDKDSKILDIGFGTGWFLAACIQLGYTNLYGAEFGFQGDSNLLSWSNQIRGVDQIHSNIGGPTGVASRMIKMKSYRCRLKSPINLCANP